MKEEIYIDSDGQELTKKTWSDGDIWYLNKQGQSHRLDGPAKIWKDGTEIWYKDGQLHRLNGPSIVFHSGSNFWYKDGLRHREDGPSSIDRDGTEYYYLEGKKVSKKEYYKMIGKSNEHKS